MKHLFLIFSFSVLFFGCASVGDSVISAINEEQFNQLNSMYALIQDYRFNENSESLDKVRKELDGINLGEIYNKDYKAKILGLKSLTFYYMNNVYKAKTYLRDLEEVTIDEELYWIVTALLEKDKEVRLEILLEGKNKTYEIEKLDSYLADSYLENEMYGESTALYDTILLSEVNFVSHYQVLRDISYSFMQNPPSSYEYGLIIARDQIDMKNLINLMFMETEYFSGFNKDDINQTLIERQFFHDNDFMEDKDLMRKDLAYFLFALIADRKKNEKLWDQYNDYYTPELSDERKAELEGMSPITDTPLYEYYFYPVLYLIEEEIMELPDGENFFPYEIVSGLQLQYVISSLKKRVD